MGEAFGERFMARSVKTRKGNNGPLSYGLALAKTSMATLAVTQRLFTELTTRPAHHWPATGPSYGRQFRQHCQTIARLHFERLTTGVNCTLLSLSFAIHHVVISTLNHEGIEAYNFSYGHRVE
jgi:hypothetical protein